MVCYLSGCRGCHPLEALCAWKVKTVSSHTLPTSPPLLGSMAQRAQESPAQFLTLSFHFLILAASWLLRRRFTLWLGYFHLSVDNSGNLLFDWMNTSISAMVNVNGQHHNKIVILTSYWGAKPGDHPLAVRVEMEPIAAVNLKQNSSKSFAKCSLQQ